MKAHRARRVLKWGGTAACVLLVGLWVLSGWYQVRWVQYFAGGRNALMVWASSGSIHASYDVYDDAALSDWARQGVKRESGIGVSAYKPLGEAVWWTLPHWECQEGFTVDPRQDTMRPIGQWRGVQISIWIPLLVLAIPTAALWWLDHRRIPSGHCQQCGYDLTGNVSGVCPECGECSRTNRGTGLETKRSP